MSIQPVYPPVGARMEDQPGFWLRIGASLISQIYGRTLQGSGLGLPDWVALRLIADAGGLAPSRLADCMATTRGGASKLVGRLEQRGLVQRRAAPGDRRGQILHLTAEGMRLAISLAACAAATEDAFFSALAPGEIALLQEMLTRLAERHGHTCPCGD